MGEETTSLSEPPVAADERTILSTRDLRKSFGSLVAVDGISLSILEGEIHLIIGPNGSGKTTYFNLLSGHYKPDGGTVTFDGTDITGESPHTIARSGLLRTFQIVTPFNEMTVRENLLTVPYLGEEASKEETVDEIIELFELTEVAHNKASDISGGQQKLLEMARPMVLDPECMLLDEPTAGINPALQNRIIDFIRTKNERDGTTFVIIEHNMSVVERLADEVSVFNNGSLLVQGSFDEVYRDERVREAYLGDSPAAGQKGSEGSSGGQSIMTDLTGRDTDATAASGSDDIDLASFSGADDDAYLIAENITTGYGKHEVLHDVSMRTRNGITSIFGPNGSGKSTLLKALNGALPVWEGSLRYGDQGLLGKAPEEVVETGITTLPQGGGIFENLSVRDNLLVGAHTIDDADTVDERLEMVTAVFPELDAKMKEKAVNLSGGQQMMVSIGRSMLTGSNIYLFDEPSAGLQPSKIDQIIDLLDRLDQVGVQIVLVEQNVRAALQISDYMYILAQGEVQFEGKPEDLDDEELMRTYLGLE